MMLLFCLKKMIISSDMMIEDQHFEKTYNPKFFAKKLLRINLSDVAAMGAEPYGYTLNIALPKNRINQWLVNLHERIKICYCLILG